MFGFWDEGDTFMLLSSQKHQNLPSSREKLEKLGFLFTKIRKLVPTMSGLKHCYFTLRVVHEKSGFRKFFTRMLGI